MVRFASLLRWLAVIALTAGSCLATAFATGAAHGCPDCAPSSPSLTRFTSVIQGPVPYTSFQGDLYSLRAYEGNHVALLVPDDYAQGSAEAGKLFDLVLRLDKIYQYFHRVTGKAPVPYFVYKDKLTVAAVDDTCGYGCGWLGLTGIEFSAWTDVRGFALDGLIDPALPYEFGRNFWHDGYEDRIAYKGDDDRSAVITGFAVYNGIAATLGSGLGDAGGSFRGLTYRQFADAVKSLLRTYLDKSFYRWQWTLKIGNGVANPHGFGAADLFASFCFDLAERFGCKFTDNIWKMAAQQPVAATTQDAVDNFIVAASQATCFDLRDLFVYYKWPLSAAASQKIANFAFPVYAIPSPTPTPSPTPFPTPTPSPTPEPSPTPAPTPTPTPQAVASVKILPSKRTVMAGAMAKLWVVVGNDSLEPVSVTVRFSSSNQEVAEPETILVPVDRKRNAKHKPKTGRVMIPVSIPADATGTTVITAHAGALSATSTLTIRSPKAKP